MILDKTIEIISGAEQQLSRFAERRWQTILLVGILSLMARAALLPLLPVPKPAVQDEFSYLLAADTFSQGRLTNPTPPLAEHFETLQEIFHPTYASKYPPLQGLVLALGQKLTGVPWVGVWLSMGVLCATLCWALQGWLPPVWALGGSLIALIRIGIASYWTETYWGGTCAAIGGALVIGAVPRLIQRPRTSHSLAFAAGVAILANSRPFEGLVLVVSCAVYLIGSRSLSRKTIIPMVLLLIPVFAWMGYYNYRVTGSALEMPYMAHEKQYATWSPWWWQTEPRAMPNYTSTSLRDFWVTADGQDKQFSHDHPLKVHFTDLLYIERFYFGWPILLCILATTPLLWRDRSIRPVLFLLAAFYAVGALETRLVPHYVAPATALGYILAASAVRQLRGTSLGASSERQFAAWGVLGLFVVTTGLALFTSDHLYFFGDKDYHVRAKREAVIQQLQHEPGQQLVLVSYGPHHDLFEELVYNQADIDKSRIVWARSLGTLQDKELINYYGASRKVWMLEEDGNVILTRYVACTKGTTPPPRPTIPLGEFRFVLGANPDLSYRL